jgi:hypothetical protein
LVELYDRHNFIGNIWVTEVGFRVRHRWKRRGSVVEYWFWK